MKRILAAVVVAVCVASAGAACGGRDNSEENGLIAAEYPIEADEATAATDYPVLGYAVPNHPAASYTAPNYATPYVQELIEQDAGPPEPIVLTDSRIRWFIEPIWEFDAVFNFSEGMAAVEYFVFYSGGDGDALHVLGYINNRGEIVIPIEHYHWPGFYYHRGAPPFSHGLVAIMSNHHGGVGVFDARGDLVIPFYFTDAWAFSEGLMAVLSPTYGAWGFIDTQGNVVIDFKFDFVSDFYHGRAAFFEGGYWGFIDRAGEVAVPPMFRSTVGQGGSFIIPRFYDTDEMIIGGVWSPDRDSELVFVDVYGDIIVTYAHDDTLDPFEGLDLPRHTIIRQFREGFAVIGDGFWPDSRWGFIDIEGNLVVPMEFDEVRDFSEGLAWVRQGGFWGLIEITER